MRAIFVSDSKKKVSEVYSNDVILKLKTLTDMDENIYSRSDILESKECFGDTEYIFSTWGMPKFTVEEIKEIFPSLRCIFYSAGSVQSFAREFLECGVKIFSAWAANAVPVAEYISYE